VDGEEGKDGPDCDGGWFSRNVSIEIGIPIGGGGGGDDEDD
jgi:hypothetical protein